MKKQHQQIWINVRAEVIKHFHDTRNEGMFKGGFSYEVAQKLAQAELAESLNTKWFILSLDEMLLKDLEECACLAESRIVEKIKHFIRYGVTGI